jgi:hypothetical protein
MPPPTGRVSVQRSTRVGIDAPTQRIIFSARICI